MKKSEWIYLSKIMWAFAESNEGKISPLLKELIQKINKNQGVIIDDMGEYGENVGSNGQFNSNTTGSEDFRGNGEF
jgi:hypothetical protein|tara:strand:- start:187 stop:414 length:228 start_codon:yes stop_codon:yes gene_type:complete